MLTRLKNHFCDSNDSKASPVFSALFCLAFSGVFALGGGWARADMSDADYQAALRLAQKKVQRAQSLKLQSVHALSSGVIRNLYGQNYRVGDSWDVAAWSFANTMARMTIEPDHLQSKGGRGGLFHYEVTEVQAGATPSVTLRVTQSEGYGLTKPDARVQSLELRMDDRMNQSAKTYRITDRSGQLRTLPVIPEGVHSTVTGLEMFALDVPELLTAERAQATAIPALPEGLQRVAEAAGYHPDPARSVSYEQDDFFGRGVQAVWQQGQPWPAYLKTSNGVSILIRAGQARSS